MEPKQLLSQMADIFESQPERWTFGAGARDAKNEAVDALSPDAFSFTAAGFLDRARAERVVDEAAFAAASDLYLGAVREKYHHTDSGKVDSNEGREAVIACARLAAR